MKNAHARRRRMMGAGITVVACTLIAAGVLLSANAAGTGLLWLGPGPGLAPQVEERLQPSTSPPAYGSVAPGGAASPYDQPLEPVKSWQVVHVRTRNTFPILESLLDDDPVYSLVVELDVEYANGGQARLQWNTWRYGWVLGPLVVSYGDGPPGELSRLPDAEGP
ncbi:MAG: hypothetical protein IT318_26420 [Anaerolineales bacterium]|nr:hypothetical protein [Anaerolineales bacterium]